LRELLIIDGYNVLHFSPGYRSLLDEDLESARVRLVEDVANFAGIEGVDAIVVFDASNRKGARRSSVDVLGVRVLFTGEGETADSAIERLAHEARGDRRVRVATSDYAQQRAVFAKGVLRMSARELVDRIQEEAREAAEHSSSGPRRVFLEDRLEEEIRNKLRRYTAK